MFVFRHTWTALLAAMLCSCDGGTAVAPSGIAQQAASRSPQSIGGRNGPGAALQTLKIFGTNFQGNTVTAYDADGMPTAPTIAAGLDHPFGVAVDSGGKIYVTNFSHGGFGDGTLTTYHPDGTRATPTIQHLCRPFRVAVDAGGKIYILGCDNTVRTYAADGTPTTPVITGSGSVADLALDATGKIYLTSTYRGTVTTYNPDGSQTSPTISGLDQPRGIAVDASGKIYVSQQALKENSKPWITTYTSAGVRTTPTISGAPLNFPWEIALGARGKIYVLNQRGGAILTYDADGAMGTPTINGGFSGIAVHAY